MRTYIPALAAGLLLSLAGCAHAPPPTQATPAVGKLRDLALSSDIRKICKIEEPDRSPKFDFDSSDISGADRDVLAQVARCMISGPLRDRAVQLIGRADPRGEPEYNMTLGSSRSGHVNRYLINLGVSPAQMMNTSRGELDAVGTNEEEWQRDRRVDMRLVSPMAISLAEAE